MAQRPTTKSGVIRMASVDWLTATATTPVGREEYRQQAIIIGRGEEAAGNKTTTWLWQGYAGLHCGALTYGERQDGAILRLSGVVAANHWRRAVRWSHNVSRLDLQVTVYFRPFPKDLASQAYDDLVNLAGGEAPRNQATLIQDTNGAETLYLGSRKSDKFARLYNKQAESPDPEYLGCWRYELELKNKPAKSTATHLFAAPDERPHLATYVWRHFADRAVPPYFSPELAGGLIPVPRSRSDDDRALTWLNTQVRAVVQRLTNKGRGEDVGRALGLQ